MVSHERKVDLLVNYFENSECSEDERTMGIELEHFVVKSESLEATTYYEEKGIEALLRTLAGRSWEPKLEGGHVTGLEGQRARVALEPGGQLELSILPQNSVSDLETIYLDFVREVTSVLGDWNESLICLGYQPESGVEEIPLIPKERYDYMYDYFGDRGKYAYNMMKATGAIHVNLDYLNEKDYVKKNLVANVLSPLVYTVIDNSPYFEGEISDEAGIRGLIWENCDVDRCGYPVGLFEGEFGYRDYAEYLLKTPPMVYKKQDELVYSKDKLLEEILLEDLDPTEEDMDYLLTTVFPDVRTKDHLEIRMGDSLPYPYSFAYLVFWKGLLYDEENLNQLYEKYKDLTEEEFLDGKLHLTERGTDANWGGEGLFSAYRDLLELAAEGLDPEERYYLEPLSELAEKGMTPKQKTLKMGDIGKARALSWCNLNKIINQKE
jgi:glutamate--cysteine ligase